MSECGPGRVVPGLFPLLLAACESQPHLTGDQDTREISMRGNRDELYHAMVKGLERCGYEIEVAKPNSLYIKAVSGERTAIAQGEDKGDRVIWQLGLAGAGSLGGDFRRISRAMDKALKQSREAKK